MYKEPIWPDILMLVLLILFVFALTILTIVIGDAIFG